MARLDRFNHPLNNPPPSASEAVAALRLRLHEYTLLELEDCGLVEWDRENHVVKEGPRFEEYKID